MKSARSTPAPTARSLAAAALIDIERRSGRADETLDRLLRQAGLDARDRNLSMELVYGVLRHRLTLDWRLARVSDLPIERIALPVLTALRLGAYQLLYLTRIPPSAAVNESVRLIKQGRTARSAGFVNAVLRALLRGPTPAWPNVKDDPAYAYSIRYACPVWLTGRWVARFGERAEELCRATVDPPPLTVRANTLRVTREELKRRLEQAELAPQPTVISPVGLILEKRGAITELPFFQEGAFYIEDEAAQLIPLLLDPQPGERVLDACAAPGGKATHLAALMRNQGEIVALDRSARRLALLADNCRRLGVDIVRRLQVDASRELTDLGTFDRVLLDAPCSGLGVLRRHPEGKWQKTEEALARHHAAQLNLLEQVCRVLRPAGVLVYSTCSTEAEENESVVERFCAAHREFSREPVSPWLPPSGRRLVTAQGDLSTMFSDRAMDGFFAARLRKAA